MKTATKKCAIKTPIDPVAESVVIEVFKDKWTNSMQLSIGDKNGGFRLCGPKFNGSGSLLMTHTLGQRDADEIRGYLDNAFPRRKRRL